MQERGNENNGALPWIFKSDDEVLPLARLWERGRGEGLYWLSPSGAIIRPFYF